MRDKPNLALAILLPILSGRMRAALVGRPRAPPHEDRSSHQGKREIERRRRRSAALLQKGKG